MAAEVQVGTAVIAGITNSGSAITITGFATFLFDTAQAQHHFDVRDTKDATAYDVNLAASNEYLEVTLDFEPSGATRAAAAAVFVMPSPLAAITLANFKIAMFNGAYVYMGDARVDLSKQQNGKISGLKIRKYADSTQNTSLTGGAISG